jgi:peptidoglycan/xylan/chitin deacetylase (PgdA/CDA1 family)
MGGARHAQSQLMKKLFVLLLLLAGGYFALSKWSPQTLEKIAFWRSGSSTPTPAPALPPAEPAPTPTATKPGVAAVPAQPATTIQSGTPPPAPAPPSETTPAKPAIQVDKTSQVIVLLYHRLEGNAGGIYSITPELFEEHLQKLKTNGIEIISMADFLAWRRGEKSIPPKSAIITIDDGYASAYDIARPILKKHGYPWTYFVYTKFVGTGGKSISWEQLSALRQEGVEIGSHTVSHQDLRDTKGKTPEAYEQWLREEIVGSKQIIEKHIGGKCAVFAYPVGGHNQRVRELVKEAGYDAAFTAYGQRVTHGASQDRVGRYSWSARRPQDMKQAFDFNGPIDSAFEPPMAEGATGPQ